jgi:hypothetical protein
MMVPLSADVHPATWRFIRGIYRRWYAPRPELTLVDWLSDMRRAHAALLGEDVQIDRMLVQSITVLEYIIIARGGQLPPELI